MTDKELTFVLNCYRDMAGKDLNDVICVPSKDMIAIVDYVREQKAKICKLKEKNSNLTYGLTSLKYDLAFARGEIEFLKQDALTPVVTKIGNEVERREKIKAEAIKEFFERFKKTIEDSRYNAIDTPYTRACNSVADWCIETADSVKKEMVGDNNE